MRPVFVRLSEKWTINLAHVKQFNRIKGGVLRVDFVGGDDWADLDAAEAEVFLAAVRVYEFAPGGVNPPSPGGLPRRRGGPRTNHYRGDPMSETHDHDRTEESRLDKVIADVMTPEAQAWAGVKSRHRAFAHAARKRLALDRIARGIAELAELSVLEALEAAEAGTPTEG